MPSWTMPGFRCFTGRQHPIEDVLPSKGEYCTMIDDSIWKAEKNIEYVVDQVMKVGQTSH